MFLYQSELNSVYVPFKMGKPSRKVIPKFMLMSNITIAILKYYNIVTFLNV